MILYKLSFTDNIAFEDFLEGFEDVDGLLPFEVLYQGYVPEQPVYDEDGNLRNEDMHHVDYAVDILTEYEFNELDAKMIAGKSKYYHVIIGYDGTIKTK